MADLQAERQRASFKVKDMALYLDQNEEIHDFRKKLMLEFERELTFSTADYYELTKDQQRQRVMTRVQLKPISPCSPFSFGLLPITAALKILKPSSIASTF